MANLSPIDPYARRRGSAVGIGAPLSLEASLDEENREVLATLSRQRSAEQPPRRISRGESPLPSIRSMLDVDSPTRSRHGSSAGISPGVLSPTSTRDQRKPSTRLDPSDPSTWTRPHRTASPSSAKSTTDTAQTGLPKINFEEKEGFEKQYNFDMASMPTSTGTAGRGLQNKNSIYSATTLSNDMSDLRVGPKSPKIAVSPPGLSVYAQSSTTGSAPLKLTPEAIHKKSIYAHSPDSDAHRRMSNKSSSFSSMSDGPTGRVEKDEEADEDVVMSSDDEEVGESDSEADEIPEDDRGRARQKLSTFPKDEVEQKLEEKRDEDTSVPQSKGVRSLLDPVTSPSRPVDRKPEIHPPSSFGRSGPTAADFEDDDEDADIQKAKTLGVNISPVDSSIADRNVRMIIRGEWTQLQEEAENTNRETKLYLTCTDMSIEASYALEWTVGTMLRDGDTILAIYAIEDETAPKESEGNAVVMAESAKAAQQAGDTMAKLTRQATDLEGKPSGSSKFLPVTEALKSTSSVDTRNVSKKEMERLKAMDEITEKFLKLVRKTPLQVRCMIEVIHCKSPKHLILNAIDELDPTLCVVGTRGRSSLKGVLLGSFSNYLVTKSSVPVMVARKRLKKPKHAKVNSASIRLSNNLRAPALARQRRGLENARID